VCFFSSYRQEVQRKGTLKGLEEVDRARGIKEKIKIDAVEFVTVADSYRYHYQIRWELASLTHWSIIISFER
jgi:hypothetical protein